MEVYQISTVEASNFGPQGNFGPFFLSVGLAIIKIIIKMCPSEK
jgi:hypothetical protein